MATTYTDKSEELAEETLVSSTSRLELEADVQAAVSGSLENSTFSEEDYTRITQNFKVSVH
jgi:hypothetical protein